MTLPGGDVGHSRTRVVTMVTVARCLGVRYLQHVENISRCLYKAGLRGIEGSSLYFMLD